MGALTADLKGQAALVTGSTSGIGEALARGLAASGCDVMLNGLGAADKIEALRAEIADQYGVTVLYSPANMLNAGEIAAMVDAAKAGFGRLDILVNNAGIQHVAPIEEFPAEKWDAILAINLTSCFHAIKRATPIMTAQKHGRIINIASAHGLVASPYKAAYVAAKHGVLGLTKTVALELAEKDVTCNAICPGYVRTPLVEDQIEDTAKARGISREAVIRDVMLSAQPTKKFVEYEELVGLMLYLASDAGASANGAAFPVEGGWTAA